MGKVLIIDDDKPICEVITRVLARNGIESDIATNGNEGLDKFMRKHFDVVITDGFMPDIDGNGVASKIRNSHKPDTPIIGISGTSWILDDCIFNIVIQKPISMNELTHAVTSLMTPATKM